MKRGALTVMVQRYEVLTALARWWGSPADVAGDVAVKHLADDLRMTEKELWMLLSQKNSLRLTGYIPHGAWLDFISSVVVFNELTKKDRVAAAELYSLFEVFWLRRNRDAEFAPSQKLFGRCLALSGFERVKVRAHWYWQGLAIRRKD